MKELNNVPLFSIKEMTRLLGFRPLVQNNSLEVPFVEPDKGTSSVSNSSENNSSDASESDTESERSSETLLPCLDLSMIVNSYSSRTTHGFFYYSDSDSDSEDEDSDSEDLNSTLNKLTFDILLKTKARSYISKNIASENQFYIDEMLDCVSKKNMGCFVYACEELSKNSELITVKNLNKLIQSGSNAGCIADVLSAIKNKFKVSQKRFEKLCEMPEMEIKSLSNHVTFLRNYHLLTPCNFDVLIKLGTKRFTFICKLQEKIKNRKLKQNNFNDAIEESGALIEVFGIFPRRKMP